MVTGQRAKVIVGKMIQNHFLEKLKNKQTKKTIIKLMFAVVVAETDAHLMFWALITRFLW